MGFCEGLSGAQFSLMFSLTALVKNLNIKFEDDSKLVGDCEFVGEQD